MQDENRGYISQLPVVTNIGQSPPGPYKDVERYQHYCPPEPRFRNTGHPPSPADTGIICSRTGYQALSRLRFYSDKNSLSYLSQQAIPHSADCPCTLIRTFPLFLSQQAIPHSESYSFNPRNTCSYISASKLSGSQQTALLL